MLSDWPVRMSRPVHGANVLNTGPLARGAWLALEHAPSWCDPMLHAGRRWVLPFSRPSLPVELRRGPSSSGEHASVLFIGRGMQLEYLSRRFFVTEPEREPRPSVGFFQLGTALSQALDWADLVMALVPRALSSRLAGNVFLRVPAFVDFVLPTAAVAEFEDANQSVRRYVRGLRTSDLRPRVSNSRLDFEKFYSDYYSPMVSERFGDLSIHQPIQVLRRRFRFGGIIWVEREGTSLAGQLYELRGRVLKSLVRGGRSTHDDRLDAMVAHATYLFSMEHARDQGCILVNMGGALPVLDDGLFCHKRAWGALATSRGETHYELLIGWRGRGRRVLSLLQAAPLVYHDRGRLAALAAFADATPVDPRRAARVCRAWLPRGIDRLTVLAPEGWLKPARGTSLPHAQRLRLRAGMGSQVLRTMR